MSVPADEAEVDFTEVEDSAAATAGPASVDQCSTGAVEAAPEEGVRPVGKALSASRFPVNVPKDGGLAKSGSHAPQADGTENVKPIVAARASVADPLLPQKDDDPRAAKKSSNAPGGGGRVKTKGAGRNTESFDPRSTLVRPEMRVIVGPNRPVLDKPVKHDDVIIVPNFFCEEDNWDIYYKLVEEIREINGVKKEDWVSWHEGAHLIAKNYESSPTFQAIQAKISAYFGINNKSVGTRLNWYRDSNDWKPFHNDSAAFNPQRARNQNITVGVSFGSTRELAFHHATTGHRVYFPQTNGMLFSFGRDTNIKWKHGVNALPEEEKDGKGRISIVLWGLVKDVVEEENSPPMINNRNEHGGPGAHGHGNRSGPASGRFNDRDRDRDRDGGVRGGGRSFDRGRDEGRGAGGDRGGDRGREFHERGDRGHFDRSSRDSRDDRGDRRDGVSDHRDNGRRDDRERDHVRDRSRERDWGRDGDRQRGYDRGFDRDRDRDRGFEAHRGDRAPAAPRGEAGGAAAVAGPETCREFGRNGSCRRGDQCRYTH